MRVNLNKVAEQIVPEYRHKQFVDNVIDLDLPPLYRGCLKTFYPTTLKEVRIGRSLRRYIFQYNSNGSYDFITARDGQRNGGNDVLIENAQINVIITDPENDYQELNNVNFNIINEKLYRAGDDVRIIKINQRYLWQEKAPGSFLYSTLYYSEPTSKSLHEANKENDVNWFEQTTDKYLVAVTSRVVFYNNNTLAGLNGWPIRNKEVRVPKYVTMDWQDNVTISSNLTTVAETRPLMLDDSYLTKCFRDVNLNAYDIVFVEVAWKEYRNKRTFISTKPMWLGESFKVPVRKGRVYRVGKLAKSNDIGDYDVITFALRTKIKTTHKKRGGDTVYR